MIPVNINIINISDFIKTDAAITSSIQTPGNANNNDLKQISNQSVANEHLTAGTSDMEATQNRSDTATLKDFNKNHESKLSTLATYLVVSILSILWLVGVILFLLYHLIAYFSFKAKIKRWSILIKDNTILEQFHDICSEMDIKRHIDIVSCNQISSPILFGLIKPCIVLPSKEFTKEQYHFILKHELIHYKNHDLLYKLILMWTTALHWFNPFVHYMVYLANNDIELYCDEILISKNNLNYRESYSNMMIYIMTGATKNSNILLSTGFGNDKKQLKNRFYQIMNSKPTKRGTIFVVGLACFIIVAGNLIANFGPIKISNAEVKSEQNNSDSGITNLTLEGTKNILVVGVDGTQNENSSTADSILVVSIIPDKKKIVLVSFLRDMYMQIPNNGSGRLNSSYSLGGTSLTKDTIESNFGLKIDQTVTVNMDAFEKIIDSIGGVELELSQEEADYLNNTNYISDKKNRNVIAGKQKLNGNQALGYVRVRHVPTLQGETNDLGRTIRLRNLISSVINENNKKNIDELVKELTIILPNISTDMNAQQLLLYLKAVLLGGMEADSLSIPAKDSYTEKIHNHMHVLDIDLDKNKALLQQIYQ
jgi:cell envelope-related function transcriptional attenuator common domain